MHLIALALAHLDNAGPDITRVLFCAPTQEVLHRILGRCPPGTKRILDLLPPTVLSQQGYQNLVSLLDDPRSARLLHHLDHTEITDSIVRVLYEVPTALRPILMRLVPFVSRLNHVPDGLRWLVARGGSANLDELVADLATHTQPTQFIARLSKLVENLPLPQTLPPLQIKTARRIRHNRRPLRAGQELQQLSRCLHQPSR